MSLAWLAQDEQYYRRRIPEMTGIDPETDYTSGVIVIAEHGHDTMPVTIYSRVAWKCDDALFKIAHPKDWFGYMNCSDEEENDRTIRDLLVRFDELGIKPTFARRAK